MSRASAVLDRLGIEKTKWSQMPTGAALPVLNPAYMPSSARLPGSAPLTIFYNGTVAIFEVPRHKAEIIMKLATEGNASHVAAPWPSPSAPGCEEGLLMEKLNGDTLLPVARRKSLQRFLEKRKQRMTTLMPYYADLGMATKTGDTIMTADF